MKKYILTILFSIITLLSYSQRDFMVVDSMQNTEDISVSCFKPHMMRFVLKDSIYISENRNALKWSENMGNYIFYSRIEMGKRMNYGIHYNKLAKNYFNSGTACLVVASIAYTAAAYTNPMVYIESHSKYNREYFNEAKFDRNVKTITGVVFTAIGVYCYYKSNKYSKKSKWMISPDGVRYNF